MGLQNYGYIAAGVIAFANLVFGALYMYSLGVFNEGGGSYTASMRYLAPTLSLIVAVTLIQDYVLTIVVSALSGADQFLSIINAYGINLDLAFLYWGHPGCHYLVSDHPGPGQVVQGCVHHVRCVHHADRHVDGWAGDR